MIGVTVGLDELLTTNSTSALTSSHNRVILRPLACAIRRTFACVYCDRRTYPNHHSQQGLRGLRSEYGGGCGRQTSSTHNALRGLMYKAYT